MDKAIENGAQALAGLNEEEPLHGFANHSLQQCFAREMTDGVLIDCLLLRASQIMELCREAAVKFDEAAMGFHMDGKWKKDLKPDSGLMDVLSTAAGTIGKLKGTNVKTRLDDVLQVGGREEIGFILLFMMQNQGSRDSKRYSDCNSQSIKPIESITTLITNNTNKYTLQGSGDFTCSIHSVASY